ncbi:hypothetical protein D9M68_991030 [compost metagenome]
MSALAMPRITPEVITVTCEVISWRLDSDFSSSASVSSTPSEPLAELIQSFLAARTWKSTTSDSISWLVAVVSLRRMCTMPTKLEP